jgi:hypothetical protein
MLVRRAAGPSAAMVGVQLRSYIEIKGDTKFRLDKMVSEKDQKGALKKYWSDVNEKKLKTFASRKEELAHLASRPDYEYVSDLQRSANDLTHVMSSPQYYISDVPYHYHKLWKAITVSKTNSESGNGEIEVFRVIPQ